MGFLKHIKSQDLFGHKVELQFNGQGSTHNTLIGGAISIFVKLIMFVYIYMLTEKLIEFGDDKNSII